MIRLQASEHTGIGLKNTVPSYRHMATEKLSLTTRETKELQNAAQRSRCPLTPPRTSDPTQNRL